MRHKKTNNDSAIKKSFCHMVYDRDLSTTPVEDRELPDDRDIWSGCGAVATICECGSRSELFKHNKNKT